MSNSLIAHTIKQVRLATRLTWHLSKLRKSKDTAFTIFHNIISLNKIPGCLSLIPCAFVQYNSDLQEKGRSTCIPA